MAPAVQVFLPTFNGERYVGEAVSSLLAQDYGEFPIVALDDASEDSTVEVLESFEPGRVSVERSELRLGLSANWNRALDQATSEFVLIAHQDDRYRPDFLTKMIELLRRHPGAFAAHCRAVTIGSAGERIYSPENVYKESFWPSEPIEMRKPEEELLVLREGNYVICPSVVMRTEAVNQIGRFKAEYRFVTDWDYWTRGLLAGFGLCGTREKMIEFRRHGDTETLRQQRTFERFREEREFLVDLSTRMRERGLATPGDDLRPLHNTLSAAFVEALREGGRDRALAVLSFAEIEGHGFADSGRGRLLRLFSLLGRPGGRLLRMIQWIVVRAGR